MEIKEPILSLRGIRKNFGNINALHSIDLDLQAGEVLSLLGDNGAGKSTLSKIISGYHLPDEGTMTVQGKKVHWRTYSVSKARQLGIETVYQERSLAEQQPLWRNIFVGRSIKTKFGLIDVKKEKEETLKLLKDFMGLSGVGVDPNAYVSTLSGGERQGLAIARARYFDAQVIIFDEPTTALAISEVKKVVGFIKDLRANGKSCLLITHDMDLVMSLADRYVLLEQGTITGRWNKGEISEEKLIRRMTSSGVRL